jgi:hypothetical protein
MGPWPEEWKASNFPSTAQDIDGAVRGRRPMINGQDISRWTADVCRAGALAAAAFGVAPASALAQSISEGSLDVVQTGDTPEFGFASGSVVVAPIPFSNPTVGSGLALGGAWLFTADPQSTTSSIGVGGFKSDNGSSGYAFGTDLSLAADRYQLSILIGEVDLTYDFNAGRFDFPLTQTASIYRLDLGYGLSREVSVGVGLRYVETSLSTDFLGDLPPEIDAALDLNVLKYGLTADWDNRDSDLYPTRGGRVALEAFRGDVRGDVGRDYDKAVLQGQVFRQGFGRRDVVAGETTACAASETAPFFDTCSLGLVDGLRGFSVTDYIGNRLLSAQAEYRGRIGGSRFGYAVFAGGGWVGETLTSDSGVHGAAGAGLRFRLSRSFPVDFSVDLTANSDGDSLYYVYVGQSF